MTAQAGAFWMCLALLLSTPAHAREDRPTFLLNGGLRLSSGWTSNPDKRGQELGPLDSALVDIGLWLSMETPNPALADFTFHVAAAIRAYPMHADTPRLSVGEASGSDGDLRVAVWPSGPVTFRIRERFYRGPEHDDLAFVQPTNHFQNVIAADLVAHGAGWPVLGEASYGLETDTVQGEPDADYLKHRIRGAVVVPLPQHSTFWVSGELDVLAWSTPRQEDAPQDAMAVRALVGVDGALSPNVRGTARVGYGDSLHATDPFQHVIGDMEVRWILPTVGWVNMGYARRFRTSRYAGWFAEHRIYTERHLDLGPVSLEAGGSLSIVEFREFEPKEPTRNVVSHTRRTGELVGAHASLTYRALPWLDVTLAYDGAWVFSNFRQQEIRVTTAEIQTELTIWRYRRHTLQAGLHAHF